MGQFINKLNACILEVMVSRSVEMSIDKIFFVLVSVRKSSMRSETRLVVVQPKPKFIRLMKAGDLGSNYR